MNVSALSRKTILLILGFCVLFVLFLAGSYFYFAAKKVYVAPVASPTPTANPEALEPSSKVVNFLLLGHGGEGHQGGSLMDAIIVISIDTENKKAALISVPRDIYLSLPTDFENSTNHKINEAYSIGADNVRYANKKPEFKGEAGGWNLMKYAAGQVTGLTPEYFVAVDFGGFKKVIDILDGVSVNVPKVYDDYFYPTKGKENETCGFSGEKIAQLHQKYSGFELEKQFECRYEHIHFDSGPLEMDGETALKYTRSRHGDGDFGRSQRQAAVLAAIKDDIVSLDVIGKGGALLGQLTDSVKTDLTPDKIKAIADFIGSPGEYEIKSIHLSEDNVLRASKGSSGAYILVPVAGLNNFSEIQSFISQNL